MAVDEDGGMVAGGVFAVDAGGGVIGVVGWVADGAVADGAVPGSAFSLPAWLQAASANEEASSRLQHSMRIFMAVSFSERVSAAGIRRGSLRSAASVRP